jgi:two-component system sensor histidine kinase/response regulator
VNMSKASAETLLNVINDILDFSKIEAGKLEVESKEFELHNMLEETMEAMAVSAHHKGLEIILQSSNEVPDKLIGDAGHLRQILINLIGNAVKFTKQGEIVLRVEVEAAAEKDIELHFSIKDSGIGVQKEKQELLFRPFEQVDGSNQRKYGGSGLGLSICKQLVSLMGGRIWFKSWQGEGSVFHFTVKFKKPEISEPDSTTKTPAQLAGVNLLLVDDNDTYRSVLRNMLNCWGITVTEADSAHSALKEIEDAAGTSRSFRIVLMDEEMPGVNGLTAAGQIIQSLPQDCVLVMMLPSDNISDDFAKCQELGITNYLIKPIKQMELLNAVLKILGQDTDDEETNVAVESTGPAADSLHLNILVAEDNTTSQMIAKKTLEKAGHTIQIASSGVEAIRMLREGKFDLILMDVEMPEMSGIEATRVIRKTEAGTKLHIPIVAMTAYAMKEDRQRCLDAGMDTYISKPVNLNELHKIIKDFSFTKSEETPAVDIEAALKFVAGEKSILKEVVGVFLEDDYPEQIKRLKEGFSQQNADMVKEAAHSIKGAVRSLGGTESGEKALRLEEMGRNNKLEEVESTIKELEQDIDRFREFYSNYNWQENE